MLFLSSPRAAAARTKASCLSVQPDGGLTVALADAVAVEVPAAAVAGFVAEVVVDAGMDAPGAVMMIGLVVAAIFGEW